MYKIEFTWKDVVYIEASKHVLEDVEDVRT